MTLTITQVIEQIPGWQGQPAQIEPIRVGRTNTNYKVTIAGTPYFVRIPGPGTHLLGIDRRNEFHNIQLASQQGIAPHGLYFLAQAGVLVLEFIHGSILSPERLLQPDIQHRLIQVVKRLHAGPRLWQDFNMFRTTESYLRVIQEHSFELPPDFLAYLPQVKEIERVMLADPAAPPQVPCHNDLAPENMLENEQKLILVDFDYSGNNDPCFELGNFWVQMNYNETQLRQLVGAYFGEVTASKLARTQLHGLMCDIGWTLWCVIQAKASTIGFDFWEYAIRRWARAVQKMESTEFESWLKTVFG